MGADGSSVGIHEITVIVPVIKRIVRVNGHIRRNHILSVINCLHQRIIVKSAVYELFRIPAELLPEGRVVYQAVVQWPWLIPSGLPSVDITVRPVDARPVDAEGIVDIIRYVFNPAG